MLYSRPSAPGYIHPPLGKSRVHSLSVSTWLFILRGSVLKVRFGVNSRANREFPLIPQDDHKLVVKGKATKALVCVTDKVFISLPTRPQEAAVKKSSELITTATIPRRRVIKTSGLLTLHAFSLGNRKEANQIR